MGETGGRSLKGVPSRKKEETMPVFGERIGGFRNSVGDVRAGPGRGLTPSKEGLLLFDVGRFGFSEALDIAPEGGRGGAFGSIFNSAYFGLLNPACFGLCSILTYSFLGYDNSYSGFFIIKKQY
jgi:hypothetical protein